MADSYLYICALCRHASPAGAEPLCLHPLTARPGRHDLPDTPRTCREARSGWLPAWVRLWLGLGRLCGPEASLMEPRRDEALSADAESPHPGQRSPDGRYVFVEGAAGSGYWAHLPLPSWTEAEEPGPTPPASPEPPPEGLTLVRIFSHQDLVDGLTTLAASDARLTGYVLSGADVVLEILSPDELGFRVRATIKRYEVGRG